MNKKISQPTSKPQALPKHNPKSYESTPENRRFNSIDAPKSCSSAHQVMIAHERLRFELEFALEPDFEVIERSLQVLKNQHEADQAIVRRVIDLMVEAGAA